MHKFSWFSRFLVVFFLSATLYLLFYSNCCAFYTFKKETVRATVLGLEKTEREFQPFRRYRSIQLLELIPFWAILGYLCLPILYTQVNDIRMHTSVFVCK